MVKYYSCPSCGADMSYNPTLGKIHCSHCDYNEQIGTDPAPEKKAEQPTTNFHCPHCGSVLNTEEKTTSLICEYCEAPLVLTERLTGQTRPQRVAPFKIDRKSASETFRKWCKNGRFTPKGFLEAGDMKHIRGLYVPYWVFDASTNVQVNGTGTRVRVYVSGETEYTETSHYEIYRSIDLDYAGIPYDASVKMEDSQMAKLEPFDMSEMKVFQMPYLAGFDSDQYDLGSDQVQGAVQNRIKGFATGYARGTVSGYATVNLPMQQVNFKDIGSNYALMPVWLVSYMHQGKEYRFMMNGQTGKVIGKPPLSRSKVLTWFGGISAAVYAIAMLVGVIALW